MEWKPRRKINFKMPTYGKKEYYIWTWPWGPVANFFMETVPDWYRRQKVKKIEADLPKAAEKAFRKYAKEETSGSLMIENQWSLNRLPWQARQPIFDYIKNTLQIDGYRKEIDDWGGRIWVHFYPENEKGA